MESVGVRDLFLADVESTHSLLNVLLSRVVFLVLSAGITGARLVEQFLQSLHGHVVLSLLNFPFLRVQTEGE